MKIAFIGAGSYVFGPSMLAQAYLEEGIDDVHLALIDPDSQTVELMAEVGRRMARERGLRTEITTHAERAGALENADFVLCSASPQMHRRFAMDWEIIDRLIPGHLKTEFGGIAGISYSLRQIAFIEAVAADMRRACPDAWLLNAANPLPRVCQAAQESGIQTAGFCSVAVSAYQMLWQILAGETLRYPFAEARAKWQVIMAGVNHFVWATEFRDRATGEDLLPVLRERIGDGNAVPENPRAQAMVRETGFLLAPGDDHTRDFLVPHGPGPAPGETPWHGSPNEREERLEQLRQIGAGSLSWDVILQNAAWEKPLSFIAAFSGAGKPAHFGSLNLVNATRQIPSLPEQVFVETPCEVSQGRVSPREAQLPDTVVPLSLQTAQVTDTIVRAALRRSRALVHEAVMLDPTVLDKTAGIAAIDACLTAHADMLPAYS